MHVPQAHEHDGHKCVVCQEGQTWPATFPTEHAEAGDVNMGGEGTVRGT